MKFWDTSALVPLVVAEPETARAERWLRDDPDVVVWTLTRVELLSALQIGAALVAADGDPSTLTFITFDARQAEAAEREGLAVLGGD